MGTRISQLPPKGANLANTDLLMISQTTTDGYESKSITGAEIIASAQDGVQPTLVSGTNIKTVNSTSLLGSGNVAVQPTLVSGTNIKTINGNSLLGSGDLVISTGLTIGTTAITSGTVGRVLFEGTGNVVQESSNLFWDNTNSRLGIGTASPNMSLDVRTGNVGIGVTSNAGYKLDVNGTARVVNNILSGNGTYFTTGSQSIASASTSNAYVEISSGASSSGSLVWSKAGSLSTLWQLYSDSSNNIAFFRNGVNREIFKIFESTKNVGIDENSGTASFADITSAKLFVNSTTKGFLPPRMTTTQRNAIASPASGLIVYDTTDNKHYGYNGTAWTAFY